jgi:hypothetical protein
MHLRSTMLGCMTLNAVVEPVEAELPEKLGVVEPLDPEKLGVVELVLPVTSGAVPSLVPVTV